MRFIMNIAALRNMIAVVRNMIAVVCGNALRHQHSTSRTSRHGGDRSLSRRDDFSNTAGILEVTQWLQGQGWQWRTLGEVKLYLPVPAVIKPAVVARATKTAPTSLRPYTSY